MGGEKERGEREARADEIAQSGLGSLACTREPSRVAPVCKPNAGEAETKPLSSLDSQPKRTG